MQPQKMSILVQAEAGIGGQGCVVGAGAEANQNRGWWWSRAKVGLSPVPRSRILYIYSFHFSFLRFRPSRTLNGLSGARLPLFRVGVRRGRPLVNLALLLSNPFLDPSTRPRYCDARDREGKQQQGGSISCCKQAFDFALERLKILLWPRAYGRRVI